MSPARLAALAAIGFITGSVAFGPVGAHAAAGDPLATCFTCHGEQGHSTTPLVPSIGGQPSFFTVTQLFLFRDGRRGQSAMIDVAKTLSNDDLRSLAAQLEKLPAPPRTLPAAGLDNARMARGQALATSNHCGVCHEPDYAGRKQMPRLAGQREDYLLQAMRDFKSGRRLGYGQAMTSELATLDDGALADLAYYLAYLPE